MGPSLLRPILVRAASLGAVSNFTAGALFSAMALVQFCGWSEERAKRYWNEARNNAPCGGSCDSWIDAKFKNFKYDPALEISDAQRAAICPK